jgi:hypothetical protein
VPDHQIVIIPSTLMFIVCHNSRSGAGFNHPDVIPKVKSQLNALWETPEAPEWQVPCFGQSIVEACEVVTSCEMCQVRLSCDAFIWIWPSSFFSCA